MVSPRDGYKTSVVGRGSVKIFLVSLLLRKVQGSNLVQSNPGTGILETSTVDTNAENTNKYETSRYISGARIVTINSLLSVNTGKKFEQSFFCFTIYFFTAIVIKRRFQIPRFKFSCRFSVDFDVFQISLIP